MRLGGIPASALLLGGAGLLPFVWAALQVLGLTAAVDLPLPDALRGDGRAIMLRYGGIILPFMSGALWGFATRATGARMLPAYVLSVVPALYWFLLPGAVAGNALVTLGAGFAGLLLIDYAFQRWRLAPGWWMALRLNLTAVVLACLAVGHWG